MTVCTSCGKKCLWAVTAEGKKLLLDAVAPCYTPIDVRGRTEAVRNTMTYVLHFATCPHASQHSKARKVA